MKIDPSMIMIVFLSSVFPLMIKDNLVLIFWLTFVGFFILSLQRFYIHFNQISLLQFLFVGVFFSDLAFDSSFFQSIAMILLTIPFLISAILIPPPSRYPDLWSVGISTISSLYFLMTLFQFHFYQWNEMHCPLVNMKKSH